MSSRWSAAPSPASAARSTSCSDPRSASCASPSAPASSAASPCRTSAIPSAASTSTPSPGWSGPTPACCSRAWSAGTSATAAAWKAEWVALPEVCLLTDDGDRAGRRARRRASRSTPPGCARTCRHYTGSEQALAAAHRSARQARGAARPAGRPGRGSRAGPLDARRARRRRPAQCRGVRRDGARHRRRRGDGRSRRGPCAALPVTRRVRHGRDRAAARSRSPSCPPRCCRRRAWPTASGCAGPLLVKRDDLTGFAVGGNKIRQLELLLARGAASSRPTCSSPAARSARTSCRPPPRPRRTPGCATSWSSPGRPSSCSVAPQPRRGAGAGAPSRAGPATRTGPRSTPRCRSSPPSSRRPAPARTSCPRGGANAVRRQRLPARVRRGLRAARGVPGAAPTVVVASRLRRHPRRARRRERRARPAVPPRRGVSVSRPPERARARGPRRSPARSALAAGSRAPGPGDVAARRRPRSRPRHRSEAGAGRGGEPHCAAAGLVLDPVYTAKALAALPARARHRARAVLAHRRPARRRRRTDEGAPR